MKTIKRTATLEPSKFFPLQINGFKPMPGLYKLGTDFGNGIQDTKTFQIDEDFPKYRQTKMDCKKDDITKYHQIYDCGNKIYKTVIPWIIETLGKEYPDLFTVDRAPLLTLLYCHLTEEQLIFDNFNNYELCTMKDKYAGAFDAIACNIQEDIAVHSREGTEDWQSLAHVCMPSGWDPRETIGKTWAEIHSPIPNMKKFTDNSQSQVKAMVESGPFVRFVTGLREHTGLNNHPHTLAENKIDGELYMLVERQTTVPFPEIDASLFTIRPYLTNIKDLTKDQKKIMIKSLMELPENYLKYKIGTHLDRQNIIDRLEV